MPAVKTIELKGAKELVAMRRAGRIVAEILSVLEKAVAPGVSTLDLDRISREELKKRNAKAAFLGYRGFTAALCASVNDEVVHGIPSAGRILKEGDIIGMDFGCIVDGFYGDSAISVGVGKISDEAQRLLTVTRDSLERGIAAMTVGARIGDISHAVQEHVEANGFSVVRDFVGHGIGRALHEEPPVPNFGQAATGMRLSPGLVLAIEPMVNAGAAGVNTLDDGWTAVTSDGSLSAHFEHTIVVTEAGPEILTLRAQQ